jgi:hypothetical protein
VKKFFQGSQKLYLTLLTGTRPKAEFQLKRKCPGPSRPFFLGNALARGMSLVEEAVRWMPSGYRFHFKSAYAH